VSKITRTVPAFAKGWCFACHALESTAGFDGIPSIGTIYLVLSVNP